MTQTTAGPDIDRQVPIAPGSPPEPDSVCAAARYVAGCLIERLDNISADLHAFRAAAESPYKMIELAAELRRVRELDLACAVPDQCPRGD